MKRDTRAVAAITNIPHMFLFPLFSSRRGPIIKFVLRISVLFSIVKVAEELFNVFLFRLWELNAARGGGGGAAWKLEKGFSAPDSFFIRRAPISGKGGKEGGGGGIGICTVDSFVSTTYSQKSCALPKK